MYLVPQDFDFALQKGLSDHSVLVIVVGTPLEISDLRKLLFAPMPDGIDDIAFAIET